VARAQKVAGLDAATPYRLGMGRIIEQRFDEMMAFKAGTLLGRDPEALHDMRVASRRLRAAMDVSVECFPRRYLYYHRTVKELTDQLGGVRDCDVQREALTAYRDTRPSDERAGVNRLLRDLRAEREARRVDMLAFFARLDGERFDVRFRGFLAEHSRG
jgi:CHAD domain-containing protein